MITKELIARINELSRKKRSSGLSEESLNRIIPRINGIKTAPASAGAFAVSLSLDPLLEIRVGAL